MNKSAGLRCSICCINWPMTDDYKLCPICLDADGTAQSSNVTVLGEDEAMNMKLHAEFERFYEEWDSAMPTERLHSFG